jgi:hypothetical protein
VICDKETHCSLVQTSYQINFHGWGYKLCLGKILLVLYLWYSASLFFSVSYVVPSKLHGQRFSFQQVKSFKETLWCLWFGPFVQFKKKTSPHARLAPGSLQWSTTAARVYPGGPIFFLKNVLPTPVSLYLHENQLHE